MATITVIGATTAAIAYTQTATYQNDAETLTYNAPKPVDTANYRSIVVRASALVDAEEVDIYTNDGGTVLPARDKDGNIQKLTASITMLVCEGGPTYLFSKDATDSDCGVYVTFQNL